MNGVSKLFEHKSFYLGLAFGLWVVLSFVITLIDSGTDKNENLAKSKYFQLVSVLLLAVYSLWYLYEQNYHTKKY
jgi:hypothetical protein